MRHRRRRVVRNPLAFVMVALGIVVLAGLGILEDERGLYWTVAALLVLSLRPSLTITQHGLTVSNILPRRYRWDQITGVEDGICLGGHMLRLHVRGRSDTWVWAVAVSNRLSDRWYSGIVSGLRSRWEQEEREARL